jgi:hypothetical protein
LAIAAMGLLSLIGLVHFHNSIKSENNTTPND